MHRVNFHGLWTRAHVLYREIASDESVLKLPSPMSVFVFYLKIPLECIVDEEIIRKIRKIRFFVSRNGAQRFVNIASNLVKMKLLIRNGEDSNPTNV